MRIGPGVFITVRHYSMLNVFKGIVNNIQNNTITIKLPKECAKTTFLKGDPLVVAFEEDGRVEITGGLIADCNKEEEQLEFIEDIPDEGMKMRSYFRYPVSLYADFRLIDGYGNKKCFALVKDISEYGMLIYTKESLYKGQKINLDIYLTRDIMSLSAEIVRKVEHENNYFEYGLGIKHRGAAVFNHIKKFVKKAQEEHIIKFNND